MSKIIKPLKITILFVVEGENDSRFISHLKKLYVDSNLTHVKVVIGYGGGASKLVTRAIRESSDKAFDIVIVMMDGDFAIHNSDDYEKAQINAKRAEVKIIQLVPFCLECVLLEVLGEKIKPNNCQECKNLLQKFLNRKDQSCLASYDFDKHFPKSLIDSRKAAIPALRVMVGLMENKGIEK